jgi:cytochrome P450
MNSVLPPAPAAIPPNVPAHLVVDFDVYSPTADADRFHQAFVDFQRATPHRVVWSTRHGGHWIAVRGEDVYELHADHASFSSRQYFVPAAPEQGPMGAFTLDPPQHQPFRAFLNAGLSPRIVAEKNILLKRLAADLANQIAPRRGCEFIESFADVLPLTTFLDLVDLPLADQHHLRHLANAATRAPDPAHRVESLMGLAAYL